MHMMIRAGNRGFDGVLSSIKCDRYLIRSVKVSVALTSAEVMDLAGSVD